MIIVGIDPGSRLTGWAMLEVQSQGVHLVETGEIALSVRASMAQRLVCLYEKLGEIFTQHQPQILALEKAFVAYNCQTALTLGQVRGVILMAAGQHNMTIAEYAPTVIKQSLTGYGHAPKAQIIQTIHHIFGVTLGPDQADAVALALCHSQTICVRKSSYPLKGPIQPEAGPGAYDKKFRSDG